MWFKESRRAKGDKTYSQGKIKENYSNASAEKCDPFRDDNDVSLWMMFWDRERCAYV